MSSPARWRGQGAPIWTASPPPPRLRKYPQLKVTGKTPLEVIILSAQLEETWTHFADGRTVFCTGDQKGCWLDHELVGRPRYGAWLAVQVAKIRVTHLLRLTSVAVSVEVRLRELRGDLRGRRLEVWRISGYEGSEMNAKLLSGGVDLSQLPPSPDVRYCVTRMLAADDRPKNPEKGRWRPIREAYEANVRAAGEILEATSSATSSATQGGEP